MRVFTGRLWVRVVRNGVKSSCLFFEKWTDWSVEPNNWLSVEIWWSVGYYFNILCSGTNHNEYAWCWWFIWERRKDGDFHWKSSRSLQKSTVTRFEESTPALLPLKIAFAVILFGGMKYLVAQRFIFGWSFQSVQDVSIIIFHHCEWNYELGSGT